MSNVIVYAPTGVQVDVIAGNPPADQSAEVAQLQADVQQLTVQRDQAVEEAAALQLKIDAAVAALTGA